MIEPSGPVVERRRCQAHRLFSDQCELGSKASRVRSTVNPSASRESTRIVIRCLRWPARMEIGGMVLWSNSREMRPERLIGPEYERAA